MNGATMIKDSGEMVYVHVDTLLARTFRIMSYLDTLEADPNTDPAARATADEIRDILAGKHDHMIAHGEVDPATDDPAKQGDISK